MGDEIFHALLVGSRVDLSGQPVADIQGLRDQSPTPHQRGALLVGRFAATLDRGCVHNCAGTTAARPFTAFFTATISSATAISSSTAPIIRADPWPVITSPYHLSCGVQREISRSPLPDCLSRYHPGVGAEGLSRRGNRTVARPQNMAATRLGDCPDASARALGLSWRMNWRLWYCRGVHRGGQQCAPNLTSIPARRVPP